MTTPSPVATNPFYSRLAIERGRDSMNESSRQSGIRLTRAEVEKLGPFREPQGKTGDELMAVQLMVNYKDRSPHVDRSLGSSESASGVIRYLGMVSLR